MNRIRSHLLFYIVILLLSSSTNAKDEEQIELLNNKQLTEEFINELSDVSLLSLMDFDVELNPDWQAKSPTKLSQKSSSLPANVQVISKDEIKRFGYSQLSEILNHVAGFVMTSDLALSNFGARGIHPGARAASRVLKFMLDGQPISYRSNQQNWIDRSLVPLDMVERIEIIKGPVSALYGANAFLGVVNIVTQNGDDLRIKGDIASLELTNLTNAGSGYQVSYVGANQIEQWQTVYGLTYAELDRAGLTLPISSPFYDNFATDNSHLISTTEDNSNPLTFYLKSRHNLQNNGYWQMGAHYQELDEDLAFSDLNPLFKTGLNHIDLKNAFINFDLNLPLTQNLTLDSHLAYSEGSPKNKDKLELGAELFYYERDSGYSAIDFNNELIWQLSPENLLLFGAELNQEDHKIESFNRIERNPTEQSPVSPKSSINYNNWSIYTQWLYQISPEVNTLMGYRYDKHEIYSAQHSARAGLVWSVNKNNYLKLLLGSSFQAPSTELLYRTPVQRGDIIGNSNLEPQKAKTLEIIYGGTLFNSLRFDTTLYTTKVSDLVKYRNNLDNLQAENATQSKTLGLEINLSYRTNRFYLYANLSKQKTELKQTSLFILENSQQSELFPKTSGNFGISYQQSENSWITSFNNQYVGKRAVSNSNTLIAETFYQSDDYLNSSLVFSKTFYLFDQKETRIAFKIDDLFDENFAYPGFGGIDIPSYGRNFQIRFEQRF